MKININYDMISKDLSHVLYEEGVKKNAEGKYSGDHKKYNDFVPEPMPAELWNYILTVAHDSYIAGVHRAVDEFNRQEEAKVTRAQTRALNKILKL